MICTDPACAWLLFVNRRVNSDRNVACSRRTMMCCGERGRGRENGGRCDDDDARGTADDDRRERRWRRDATAEAEASGQRRSDGGSGGAIPQCDSNDRERVSKGREQGKAEQRASAPLRSAPMQCGVATPGSGSARDQHARATRSLTLSPPHSCTFHRSAYPATPLQPHCDRNAARTTVPQR